MMKSVQPEPIPLLQQDGSPIPVEPDVKVMRLWRCSKCGAEHKLAVIPLKKLIDAIWTHPKCGGHWEIIEQIKMPMDENVDK